MMAIWMAAVQAIGKANQQAAQAKIKRANLEVTKAQAKMQGNLYGMNLEENFNKAMASDAVVSAAQNRRGGSVSAIASASEKRFNWDMDFSELSTKIQETGLEYNIQSLKRAEQDAKTKGYLNAGLEVYKGYNQSQSLLDTKKDGK